MGDGGVLYHTANGDDKVDPFFDSVEDAERFLERQAEQHGEDRYQGMVLRKTGNRKVEEATDVLTDQSGIGDFATDGGHQIDSQQPDRVWFWYNPSVDQVLQEEVEPYDVRGLFETEGDAYRFLSWYADQYDVPDTSHLELYSAEIQLEGYGRKHLVDDPEEADPENPPEQVDFAAFRDPAAEADDSSR